MLKVLLAIKSCVCHLGLRSLVDSCFFFKTLQSVRASLKE